MESEKRNANTAEQRIWQTQERKNYGGTCVVAGISLPCYTKTQMKHLYPNGGYQVAAEYAPKNAGRRVGTLLFGKNSFLLTRRGANSRLAFRIKGYVAVGSEQEEDCFVAVLENALPLRAMALIFVASLAAVGVFAISQLSRIDSTPAGTSAASTVSVELESGAEDWTGVKVSQTSEAPADGIRIPGFKSITVEAGTPDVSVNLQNPEQNNCYFVIRLVLSDTGETLYESKMIEPGKALYRITLSHALEPGTYGAQLHYDPYDKATLARLNGAVINLELIAE